MPFRRLVAAAVAVVPLLMPATNLAADAKPNDSFIAGYAAAVLERELAMKADGLTVADGRITLRAVSMSAYERSQAVKVLSSIPGVTGVTLLDDEPMTAQPGRPIERVRVSPATEPTGEPASTTDSDEKLTLSTKPTPITLWLGASRAFEPILADPRWPHLFASYHHYSRDTGDTRLQDVGSVGFGETIAFVRQTYPSGFRWEAGLQGGLFGIFDLDSDSRDLINADYFVGPFVSLRQGNFSLMGRVFHQSSHLGDEYVLRTNADPRQNYSYEEVNVLASYDLPYGFRTYAGAGAKFDVDPSTIDSLSVQYGAEWLSPTTAFNSGWLRPVVALDVQNQEEDDWAFSWSLRAGFQLEDPARFTQRLQILFEFYDGNSRDGQFYDNHVRYYGIGAHFYF